MSLVAVAKVSLIEFSVEAVYVLLGPVPEYIPPPPTSRQQQPATCDLRPDPRLITAWATVVGAVHGNYVTLAASLCLPSLLIILCS